MYVCVNSISIHELTGDRHNDMNQLVTQSNLLAKDTNVIVIDYSSLVDMEHYVDGSATATLVAETVAELIALLKNNFKLDLDQLHVVGYSLGGQIAGLSGHLVWKRFRQKIGHITALDPLGVLYTPDMDAKQRLSPDDATFVEVVHTNGGGRGYNATCGHADYFPNGGQVQPGCSPEDEECSHRRAYELIPDMWTPETEHELMLTKCDSLEEMNEFNCRWRNKLMGDLHNPALPGIYYLKTNAIRPFGQGPKMEFW